MQLVHPSFFGYFTISDNYLFFQTNNFNNKYNSFSIKYYFYNRSEQTNALYNLLVVPNLSINITNDDGTN